VEKIFAEKRRNSVTQCPGEGCTIKMERQKKTNYSGVSFGEVDEDEGEKQGATLKSPYKRVGRV